MEIYNSVESKGLCGENADVTCSVSKITWQTVLRLAGLLCQR